MWWRQNHPIIVNPLIPTLTLYPNPNLCGFEVKNICLLWLDACQQSHNPHQLNHTFSCYTFVFVWIKPTGCKVYVGISVPFEENHACCFPPFPVFWLWHLSKYLTLDNPKYLGKELCWTSTSILKKVKYRFSPVCVPYHVIGAVDGRCWKMSATMKWFGSSFNRVGFWIPFRRSKVIRFVTLFRLKSGSFDLSSHLYTKVNVLSEMANFYDLFRSVLEVNRISGFSDKSVLGSWWVRVCV